MIPKIIHYCWLSGESYPELIRNCIDSWKIKLPDYEFILWDLRKVALDFEISDWKATPPDDEKEKPVDRLIDEGKKVLKTNNIWLRQTIHAKKYAFAADFIRVYALNKYGGIYLDADVEVLGSFDRFLDSRFFIGFDFQNDLDPAIMGSEPGHSILSKLLEYYEDRQFIKPDGKFDTVPLPIIFGKKAEACFDYKRNGIYQEISEHGITIYPFEYFSPKNIYFHKINLTGNTVAVHHFDGNWLKKGIKFRLKQNVHRLLYVMGGKTFHDKAVRLSRSLF